VCFLSAVYIIDILKIEHINNRKVPCHPSHKPLRGFSDISLCVLHQVTPLKHREGVLSQLHRLLPHISPPVYRFLVRQLTQTPVHLVSTKPSISSIKRFISLNCL